MEKLGLGPVAVEHPRELAAGLLEHAHHLGRRPVGRVGEALEHGGYLAVDDHGERNGAVEPSGCGRRGAREVRVHHHVLDPSGPTGRQHAPRQPLPAANVVSWDVSANAPNCALSAT